MNKPRVLMFPSLDNADINCVNPSRDCVRGMENAGAEVVLFDYRTGKEGLLAELDKADGLFLQGGADMDPALYGEEKHETTYLCAPERDELEIIAVREAVKRDMPFFSICRGIQSMNVALGGTLWQDVPSMLGCVHSHAGTNLYFWHDVTVAEGSLVHKIVGKTLIHTNSYHHQAVKAPGEGLVVTARAGKVIEAVERVGAKFHLGVQWHPEKTLDQDDISQKFFDAFIDACKTK